TSRHFLLDHVNDTQVTKPARIIGARRTELLSSHSQRITTVSNSDIILINAVPVRSAMTG
ncbi:hypothetical protein MLO15_25210, partial [Escherichia coli]|uniref:hypothetical protein n=1 Tax=Escherichia coli TaxID=562 RepID=UPI0039877E4A|nr:hypothetical protein [Escherichia coli]